MGREGRGKRGGVRTIYSWAVSEETVYLILMYSKTEKDDLSKAELKELAAMAKEHLK